MFSQVLGRFMVPYYKIRRIAQQIRSEQYGLFLTRMSDLELASFKIPKHSPLHLQLLKDSHIRQDFNLNVLAVERNGVSHTQVDPEWQLHKGDILIVIGRQEDVDAFGESLHLPASA
jgi:trk system potassium uptake protein TrkA